MPAATAELGKTTPCQTCRQSTYQATLQGNTVYVTAAPLISVKQHDKDLIALQRVGAELQAGLVGGIRAQGMLSAGSPVYQLHGCYDYGRLLRQPTGGRRR